MPFYCPAVDGLYLRADSSFACWNSPGEIHPLVQLDAGRLDGIDLARDVLNGEAFRRMRRELYEDRAPFDYCQSCGWGCPQEREQWRRVEPGSFRLRSIGTLQVEPSFLCNLDCPQCVPIADRKRGRPPYSLDPRLFRKLVDDLVRAEIAVEVIQYGGFGEPLMTPHFADMARYASRRLRCASACDTNGNFDFDAAYLDCGLDWIVLAVDGVTQESYARYRRRGSLERVLRFARDACAARRQGDARTRIAWKMVLFEWNSSAADLREACRLADEIGLDQVRFVNSTLPGGISLRPDTRRWRELRDLVAELASAARVPVLLDDPECFAGEPRRCHGFVESLEQVDGTLRLTGWALLDDGPPDAILVSSAAGAQVAAQPRSRVDLRAAHPTIPRAEQGGFSVSIAVEECSHAGELALDLRLMRADVERVRFSLRAARGSSCAPASPLGIRHGTTLRVQA